MTLRGEKRRMTMRAAVVVLAFVATAFSASAQDALVLFKTRAKDGGVELNVRGARPGDVVQLLTDVHPDPDPARALIKKNYADGGGLARFEFSASDVAGAGGDLFAQAFTSDLRSNVVPLRVMPELYLLVDDVDARARVLRFDPTHGTLDEKLARLDADSVLAIGNFSPVAARDGALVRSGPDATGVAASTLKSGERPIDLVASSDRSIMLALTREDLPLGSSVIRLRLIESNAASNEIASLEILRGGGRLVSAWLVSDSESHRALVAERGGAIREVVLGAEPGRGLAILPLTPQTSEELLKVEIHGDYVVVVTQPGPVRSRRAATSRVLVFDLNERGEPDATVLNAVARDVVVVERPGGAAAFVALESGQIEVVALDPDGDHALLALPDVRLLARGPDDSLFAMQGGLDPAVVRIDPATLLVDRLPLLGLSKQPARHFGVFGDVDGNLRRAWLYVVQPQGGRADEDELLCVELDPVDGHPLGAFPPQQLGGRVLRTLTR
jgi:hypothetical protein